MSNYLKSEMELTSNGVVVYTRYGSCGSIIHNAFGPAIIRDDVSFWYINGKPHRENGPAIEYADGRKEWWTNGFLHRTDGPAIVFSTGHTVWSSCNKLLFSSKIF